MKSIAKRLLFCICFTLVCYIITPADSFAAELNWLNTYNDLTSRIGFIKFASSDEHTVYAAVDEGGSYDLLKSSDSGETWSSIKGNLPEGSDITWISDVPDQNTVLIVSLWLQGIFMSEDGGTTWYSIFNSPNTRPVEFDPTDKNVIYVGLLNNGGLWKTTNKGNSWNKIERLGSVNVPQIVIDKRQNSKLLVSTDPKLFKSLDTGNSWSELPIDKAFGSRIIIDKNNSSIFYISRYNDNEGIFKTLDDGESWFKSSYGYVGKAFQLAQDTNGDLYASRFFSNPNGGVWRSTDAGGTWENVQDPAWGERSTWGIDAKNGRVVVGVEGLGLFVSSNSPTPSPTPNPSPSPTPLPTPTPSPTPPAGPNPIVVVPGFGGSFSTKAFIMHEPTVQSDWEMMPFQAPSIYNPFLNALSRLNYLRDDKVFFFAYDFTKSIAVSGQWLNDYLDMVLAKNGGRKADVVGHSMGGLVTRYCFEMISGCSDKINKIVTAGTPHKGAVDDYYFWEGGDLSKLDALSRAGTTILLHTYGFPTLNHVQIIQEKIPGAKDFLPIFDYISGKPYTSLSDTGKNPVLYSLPLSLGFVGKSLALSGNRTASTTLDFSVKAPNRAEQFLGLWIDGKPKNKKNGVGDGTVLKSSSMVSGALNKDYSLNHNEYLNKNEPVTDILRYLGISPIGLIPFAEAKSVNVFYSTDPAVSVNVAKEEEEEVSKPSQNVVFVKGGNAKQRNLLLKSQKDGDFEIEGFYYDTDGGFRYLNPFKAKLFRGVAKVIVGQFNYDSRISQ